MNDEEIILAIKKELPIFKVICLAPKAVLIEIFDAITVKITILLLAFLSTMLAIQIARVGIEPTWSSIQRDISQMTILAGIIMLFVLIKDIYIAVNIVRLRLALKMIDEKNDFRDRS